MSNQSSTYALALLFLGASACTAPESVGEDAAKTAQPILNGETLTKNNYGLVAIYHQHQNADGSWYWVPRPCSGTILDRRTSTTRILTARHCATANGQPIGTITSPTQLRVTTALSPGVLLDGQQPPSDAVTPTALTDRGPNGIPGRDAIILHVNDLPLTDVQYRLGLHVPAAITDLRGKVIDAYGYGRFARSPADTTIEDGTSGAGTLRIGKDLVISNSLDSNFGHYIINSDRLLSGDSGGPSLMTTKTNVVEGSVNRLIFTTVQTGLHHADLEDGTSQDSTVAYNVWMIQSTLGYLHASSARRPTFQLAAKSKTPDWGTPVVVASGADVAEQRWTLGSAGTPMIKLHLTLTNLCLTAQNYVLQAGQPAVLMGCGNVSSQQWGINGKGQLVSIADPTLLLNEEPDKTVVIRKVADTKDTGQYWAWHAQDWGHMGIPDYAIPFDNGSSMQNREIPDWAFGYYKANCDQNEVLGGLSSNPSTLRAHSALCTFAGQTSDVSGVVVDFSSSDNRRATNTTWDWDEGAIKGECAMREAVTGIAQTTDGKVAKLLCAVYGGSSTVNCTTRTFTSDNNWPGGEDWAWGYFKGQCGPGQVVKGVSHFDTTGQLKSILCCDA